MAVRSKWRKLFLDFTPSPVAFGAHAAGGDAAAATVFARWVFGWGDASPDAACELHGYAA